MTIMIVHWLFLILAFCTVPSNSLICHQCSCPDADVTACKCHDTVNVPEGSHCTIIEDLQGSTPYVELSPAYLDPKSTRIKNPYYVIMNESISYDETKLSWESKLQRVVYGCNWDYCNNPGLISHLPTNYRMHLSETWLNSNILGNGQPVQHCHQCAKTRVCSDNSLIDTTNCPIQSCDTTCLVSDTFNNAQQCYQSYCAPANSKNSKNNKHYVEIEGILYGNQLDTQVELWKVDISCQTDDCSRPEIFKNIQAEVQVEKGDLSTFFSKTFSPSSSAERTITCYECGCYDVAACECNQVQVSSADTSYCTIVRVNYENHFTVDLEHIDRNSTRVFIRKFPFILAEESILYNETTEIWNTRANIIIYGCNWDLCNRPSLVTLVPDSFKMILSDEWLNKNILGNGSELRDCHECPREPQCGTTDFLDDGRCPIFPCNTTCIVRDLFTDPQNGELCYESYCNLAEDESEENQHRVELEGIIYGDQPDVVELWEIDIYCQADDCSRPTLFNEIRQNLTTQEKNVTTIFDNSTGTAKPQRICYDCYCYDDPICMCDTYTVADAETSYCTIIRENFGNDFTVDLEHIDRNSTRRYIRQFPYLLVEESIIYDDNTSQWNTRTNFVVYGCNWDYCNHPRYVPYLPDSFQMRLPTDWLNQNVLGNGSTIRDCHECPDAPICGSFEFLDLGHCAPRECNTTCLVSEIFDDPIDYEQCYQSFCAPPDSEFFTIDPHRVELEGVLYLNQSSRKVELWEIDIFCRADDCSRIEIFQEIREKFDVTLGDLSIFYENLTIVPQDNTTTTLSTSTTSTTSRSTTTVTITTTTTTPRTTTSSTSTSTSTTTRSTTTSSMPATTSSTTRPGGTTTTTRSGAGTCMAPITFITFLLLISRINFH